MSNHTQAALDMMACVSSDDLRNAATVLDDLIDESTRASEYAQMIEEAVAPQKPLNEMLRSDEWNVQMAARLIIAYAFSYVEGDSK